MMEGWNDGIMENKRLDFCLYLPFFQFSTIDFVELVNSIPLIQIKQIDWYIG